ncbi:MAG: xanthine dehydrogenase accessory factor [Gammaproteobacteria bacterium]|jgi:xanthine dehydrogenase accessory factor
MSNQLTALLGAWQKGRNDTDWVLGTVYKTEGSAYRKAGAMMLINGFGQQFGLLSGGCLEADILRNAGKVIQTRQVLLLEYDGNDEDDWSFQLGIGCGGKVYIMLQPISQENDLGLGDMAAALDSRNTGVYHQHIGNTSAYFETQDSASSKRSIIDHRTDGKWLVTSINPAPHLLIVGGGIDARPVVNIAAELGWRITLVDPRPANSRAAYFPNADRVLHQLDESLSRYIQTERVHAAVIMSHNIDIDADGLQYCQGTGLDYVALLGPRHRYQQVLERAGLLEEQLTCPVSAPAGLDIGGQLPESIALSILAECHAVLNLSKSLPALRLAAI